MEDEELVKENSDYLVTETTLDPAISLDSVAMWLRREKKTGQLVFHLSQGGVQKISLVERTRARTGQREKLREVLGV